MESNQSHDVIVDETSLQVIGQIQSLQQLRLIAGPSMGWRCQWKIDHDILRFCLKTLAKLGRLALYHDGYIRENRFSHEVELYYPHWNRDLWEVEHCDSMMQEAEKYATVLPSLEWIYFG
jgi:hypothetical protein